VFPDSGGRIITPTRRRVKTFLLFAKAGLMMTHERTTMNKHAGVFLVALAVLGFLGPLQADEGLWPFNLVPKSILKSRYNFEATPEWLNHLQLSSVRFGGASGSFVSPSGLVLTNHHVGRGIIQNLSTNQRDLMKTGFYARTRDEELRCPGVELSVLVGVEDVTDTVLAAEKPGMTPAAAAEARQKTIAFLEKQGQEQSGLRCSGVQLYSGGMYHLYKYKVYTDVRLVFAPEFAIAKFGGDPDNFCFPRYALDICFFRIYENGRSLSTPNYLKWGSRDLKEGDLVFLSGNPGSTGRLLTYAQLEFLRDTYYPFLIGNYQRRRALLQAFGRQGSEQARVALASLMSVENSLKAMIGYRSGLLDESLMAKKAEDERNLRRAVEGDPVAERDFGRAWDEIDVAQKAYASLFKPYQLFEQGRGFDSVYFGYARTIVRLAEESSKPDGDRLREYRDANIPSLTRTLLSPTPIDDSLEIAKLAGSLAELREKGGNTAEVRWLLGDRPVEEVARELVSGTLLKDPEVRKRYIDQSLEALYQSSDSMIKLALLVDPLSRGLRARYEKAVEAVEARNGALVTRALFKLRGTAIPPDATSSLRLSFGVVKGYVENGVRIPFVTTFKGLYERSREFDDKPPFQLPESFEARKSALRLDAPLDFVATCDSIGGNSGSPIVNRKGEFVGILFDGNIQSLPARFVYSDELNRSVMVHFQGILEALRKIYGARPLLQEILGTK
jgi:hypothetical protein